MLKILLLLSTVAMAQLAPLQQAGQLEKQGHLLQAGTVLQAFLEKNPHADGSGKMAFAMERLKRLPLDYLLTWESLTKQLQSSLADVTMAELNRWEAEGRFDWILVEGEKKYHSSSQSNLFFRYPELKARRTDWNDNSAFEKEILLYCKSVKEAGAKTGDHYVLPQRFRATMSMSIDADLIPAGETARCWLPYPSVYPFQTNMEIIEATPEVKWIDQPLSDIRSLYLEQKTVAGQPVQFSVQFEYTSYATSVDVDPDKVLPYRKECVKVRAYTAEKAPHIQFTTELRALAVKIIGQEKNPYLKARRIYNWVSENMVYSYMIEYSLIDNLSMYAYRNHYGDCGVQALLFITLCRISGIPARWQGCWMFFPGEKTIHDWAEFYIEPYGWLPCDPYEGSWAVHSIQSLNQEEKQFLKNFYFGNMTAFRMSANRDVNASLYPAKTAFRSDIVDFQRGEVEWGNHNLYFNERSFMWKVEAVD